MTFSTDCTIYNGALRVDSGPACSLGRMADFTKSLFMQWAPLSQGLIHNMRATTNIGCC